MIKRLLILDDDRDVLDVMQEVLTYEGFDVKIIDKADNIFDDIAAYQPHLLLLDYILSGINGGEICHQVKTNERTGYLPVIMVSAYPKVIASLGNYGSDGFIAKPFDITHLVNEVNRV